MRNIDLKFPNSFINDNKGQGAVELILIIEIDSNEINTLNSSFSDIASKFE